MMPPTTVVALMPDDFVESLMSLSLLARRTPPATAAVLPLLEDAPAAEVEVLPVRDFVTARLEGEAALRWADVEGAAVDDEDWCDAAAVV